MSVIVTSYVLNNAGIVVYRCRLLRQLVLKQMTQAVILWRKPD